jgi:acetyl esterase/lipase
MRLRIPVLLLAVVCLASIFVAGAPAVEAPATNPAPRGVRVERDLPYVTGGDPAQVLDLYLPEQASARPLPLIVHVHGGGWRSGSKAGGPMASLVRQGYAAASVEYRFSNKALFPAQIQDCQAAVRWLRAHSAQYNLDPEHIGAWGGSAGGHLVALLGTTGGKKVFAPIGGNEDQSDRVQAVCDFFGPTDFNTVMDQAAADPTVKNVFKFNTPSDPYSNLIGVHLGTNKALSEAVSPVHYVGKDNAPILILHGTADAMVPFAQSVEFADALRAAGVEATLLKVPNAGHGGPGFSTPAAQKLIMSFFDKHLKPGSGKIEPVPEPAAGAPTTRP